MIDLGTNRILLTGAAGWLGLNFVQALTQGFPGRPELRGAHTPLKIRCLVPAGEDASALARLSQEVEVVVGDIRSPQDCQNWCQGAGGAVLVHMAGIIHPRRVRDFYEVNLRGAQQVLTAAMEAGVRRAVMVSSNSPCGCNPHRDHLFDEGSPYHPYLHYGRSKMMMELAVKEVQAAGRIETVVIRAPWFYGPFQPARQSLFFKMIREGKGPIVGDGENRRSMAYTENLAQGLFLASTHPGAGGQTYWIADERPYTMNEIIDTVERLLEQEFGRTCAHKRLRLPAMASEVAWVIDKSLQGLGLYHQKFHVLSEMNKTIACSIAKAKTELGYKPDVSLEEGMRRSLAWALAQGQSF
ncbi:MAG TPA: NAD(P)-dependent oxidoreductase [Verrucomicrobiae bacterium]|nr:NAD(P)-dependent oxidoreductase [Verrucomicrobiae bacterium]